MSSESCVAVCGSENSSASDARLTTEAALGVRYAANCDETLVSVLRWYVRIGRPLLHAPTLKVCVDEFLWSKQEANLQRCTIEGYRSRLFRFAERYPDWLPVSITSDEVVTFLEQQSHPTTRLGWIHTLSTFFEWCVRQHYALSNPLAGIVRPRSVGHRAEIFQPDEAREILQQVRTTRQLGFWVMSLFSGMRTVEIQRLNANPTPWQQVRLSDDVIEIPHDQSKTARRTIEIRPQLRAWLEVMRNEGVPFYPTGARTGEIRHVRRQVLRRLRADSRPDLEFNMGRRSFISYSLRLPGASYAAVAATAGNSEKVIRKFYRRPVTAKAANAYFQIWPE